MCREDPGTEPGGQVSFELHLGAQVLWPGLSPSTSPQLFKYKCKIHPSSLSPSPWVPDTQDNGGQGLPKMDRVGVTMATVGPPHMASGSFNKPITTHHLHVSYMSLQSLLQGICLCVFQCMHVSIFH